MKVWRLGDGSSRPVDCGLCKGKYTCVNVGVAAGFICLQGNESYFYSVTCWRKMYVVQLLTTPRVSGKIANVGDTCRVENLVRELVASCCLSKNIAAYITLRRKTNTWTETCWKRVALSNFRYNALDKKNYFQSRSKYVFVFFSSGGVATTWRTCFFIGAAVVGAAVPSLLLLWTGTWFFQTLSILYTTQWQAMWWISAVWRVSKY